MDTPETWPLHHHSALPIHYPDEALPALLSLLDNSPASIQQPLPGRSSEAYQDATAFAPLRQRTLVHVASQSSQQQRWGHGPHTYQTGTLQRILAHSYRCSFSTFRGYNRFHKNYAAQSLSYSSWPPQKTTSDDPNER